MVSNPIYLGLRFFLCALMVGWLYLLSFPLSTVYPARERVFYGKSKHWRSLDCDQSLSFFSFFGSEERRTTSRGPWKLFETANCSEVTPRFWSLQEVVFKYSPGCHFAWKPYPWTGHCSLAETMNVCGIDHESLTKSSFFCGRPFAPKKRYSIFRINTKLFLGVIL